ncbi:MAG TPA: tyrosine-type recombinase/integrase [Mobilitalea sp.]|nr:tyrosine-type recombinase/integrase [Mobilitalea sp.]
MNKFINNNKIIMSCLLHSSSSCDSLSLSEITELQSNMKKESELKKVLDLSKIKERADGRYYIYINRKQFVGATYQDLILKLYDLYFGVVHSSLEDLYPKWQIWRRDETRVTDKTVKENAYLWAAFYKNTDIVKVPLINLKTIDFIKFFRHMTKDGTITRKRFNDSKSVLNNMFFYAIEQEIIDRNPLTDINYNNFAYKPENNNDDDVYLVEEREQILNYLKDKNDLISLAIQLDFCLISRIGEIKSLKWSDINFQNKTIRLQRQMLSSQKVNDDLSYQKTKHDCVDHIKGNRDKGFRDFPLIPKALEIIFRIRDVNPDNEYLFIDSNNKPIITGTYNNHLKAICKKLDITYRSSHKIRFCMASILYRENIPTTILQELLGHTSLAMSLHYLRNINPKVEVYSQITNALSKPAYTCIQ